MQNEGIWLNRYPNDVEAIILRTFKKGHVLRLEERQDSSGAKPRTDVEIKILAGKKARENGIELSPGEVQAIDKERARLAHILRVDDAFFREMVRVFHRRMQEVYPLGRGCDITPAHELLARAEKAAAAEKPFEFWVLILGALRKGHAICEEYRNRPLVTGRRDQETSATDSSAKEKSVFTKLTKERAPVAKGA